MSHIFFMTYRIRSAPTVHSPDVLLGFREISEYLGFSSSVIRRWVEYDGMPVATLPNGILITTRSLIDAWLLSRIEVAENKRKKPNVPLK